MSASDDGTVRLWDVETGTELLQFPIGGFAGDNPDAFSNDGKRLAAGTQDGEVLTWSIEEGM